MKTVLITGIGRGIGQALAKKFLAENYKVIGTATTGKVDFSNPNLTVYQLDLSSPESIDRCCADIARVNEKNGMTIDILINNAGAMFDNDEIQVIVDKLLKTLEVNLIGTIDFTEHIIPEMSPSGHIVSISSSAGSLTDTDMADAKTSHFPFHYPAYKISKCALNMYTRTLAMRMQHERNTTGPAGAPGISADFITVSSIHPGWVKTAMGGDDATETPEEAAESIYKLAISRPETGQFWFNGKKYPW